MSDWLNQKADEERERRLYGREPVPRERTLAGRAEGLLMLLLQLFGWLIIAAVVAAIAIFVAVKVTTDKYILDCPGVVETRDRDFIRNDSLHLQVTQYGWIVRLWSDEDGSAMAATTSGTHNFLRMKRTGTTFFLTGLDTEPGYYSPLTRTVELRIADGQWFKGQCTERNDGHR